MDESNGCSCLEDAYTDYWDGNEQKPNLNILLHLGSDLGKRKETKNNQDVSGFIYFNAVATLNILMILFRLHIDCRFSFSFWICFA
jgi:hypothetical protein